MSQNQLDVCLVEKNNKKFEIFPRIENIQNVIKCYLKRLSDLIFKQPWKLIVVLCLNMWKQLIAVFLYKILKINGNHLYPRHRKRLGRVCISLPYWKVNVGSVNERKEFISQKRADLFLNDEIYKNQLGQNERVKNVRACNKNFWEKWTGNVGCLVRPFFNRVAKKVSHVLKDPTTGTHFSFNDYCWSWKVLGK